jgi:hypothetical protein
MRLAILLALAAVIVSAAAVRDGNRISIADSDGGTTVEFASPVTIQYERWSGPTHPVRGAPLSLISQTLAVEEKPDGTTAVTSSFLVVTVSNGAVEIRTKSGREVASMPQRATRTGFQLKAYPGEQYYGLGAIDSPKLNLRGQIVPSTRPLLISNHGYGIFVPSGQATFDLAKSNANVIAVEADHPAFRIYYGPNPKEVLEQHAIASHTQIDLPESSLSNRDGRKLAKGLDRIDITESNYCDSPRILNQLSLSGVVLPAIDLAKVGKYDQLIRLLPFLYDSKSGPHPEFERLRSPWEPYLIGYLREAYDRGLPFIRPLLIQFPKDTGLEARSELYMIGDEILVAPGCNVTGVELPRGSWTDLRSNGHHQGRQRIPNAPAAGLPIYAKAGSLIPLTSTQPGINLELHYFPSPGAEFFVFEPDVNAYSQFHAAPSADFMRVESESKVARTCEWILHHTEKPKTVGETGKPFQEATTRAAMKPGTWFHDASTGNLHIVVATAAGEDHIINMSF